MANITDLKARNRHQQDQNLPREEDRRISTNTLERCLDGTITDKLQNIQKLMSLYDGKAHTWEMVKEMSMN